jgi:tetratricopeptide (TPR) repeat protein
MLVAGAAVIVGAAWAGYLFSRPQQDRQPAGGIDLTRLDASRLSDAPDVSDSIAQFEARARANPAAYLDLVILGDLYLERARQTGNVEDIGRGQTAFRAALDIVPAYGPALAGYGASLYSAHDFAGAVEWSARVPAGTDAYLRAQGTIGDAHLSTGDYGQAEPAYNRLAEQAPGASSRARLAQLAYVKGNPDEAIRLAKAAAVDAYLSGASPSPMAWHIYRVADLLFSTGGMGDAASYFESALQLDPRHYPSLAGLARVRVAQGRHDDAVRLLVRAVEIVPQPSLLAALGDVYTLTGRVREAEAQYATVAAIAQLSGPGGAVYNRELATYYADHDLNHSEAVRLAAGEIAFRKDVQGYDALAWALYRAGRHEEAADAAGRALALGTLDASMRYHAGLIYAALARNDEARAELDLTLRINPHFSILHAGNARAALAALPAVGSPGVLAGKVGQ